MRLELLYYHHGNGQMMFRPIFYFFHCFARMVSCSANSAVKMSIQEDKLVETHISNLGFASSKKKINGWGKTVFMPHFMYVLMFKCACVCIYTYVFVYVCVCIYIWW